MKELIKRLRASCENGILPDDVYEAADAIEAQEKKIEQLSAALAVKDEALRDTLDAIGALTKPHELIGYGLGQTDIDAIFSALALQPHAPLIAKVKAAAVLEFVSQYVDHREYFGGTIKDDAHDYAYRIEREGK